jgi:hypothetical protein
MGRVGTASRHSCILGRYASDTLKGRPETGKYVAVIILSGDGHRGIGLSGVGLRQPSPGSRG